MPQTHDGFIRLQLVQPFIQFTQSMGHDLTDCLDSFGLDTVQLSDPHRAVHAEIIYGLCNALGDLTQTPYLGCQVGETFSLQNWPPISQACAQAKTVGEFYTRFLTQVPQASTSVRHSLTIQAHQATYEVSRLVETKNPPAQVEGFGMALHCRLLKMVMQDRWTPEQLLLETPHPEAVPRNYLGITILRSGRRGMRLSFPTSWLWAPLTLSAPPVRAAEKDPVPLELSMIAALRSAARSHLPNARLTTADVATILGLDVPHLERALRLNGTTCAREIKTLRVEVAKELLTTTTQTIGAIGRVVGYTDQSHFARFFRSQTGFSPATYRKSPPTVTPPQKGPQ